MENELLCSRSPYETGELDGGSEGMKCEHHGCNNRSWTVWLTAAEWADLWRHRDENAWTIICRKKYGIVLCDVHGHL